LEDFPGMFHKKIETFCVDVIRTFLKNEYHTRHALSELEFLVLFGHINLFCQWGQKRVFFRKVISRCHFTRQIGWNDEYLYIFSIVNLVGCHYCIFLRFTLYLISLFAVMHLMSSYFEEINVWSHLGEEWAKNPQLFHINLFHARIESIKNEDERSLKVELTTWPGSCGEANISCQNFVSKYAI